MENKVINKKQLLAYLRGELLYHIGRVRRYKEKIKEIKGL